MDLPTPTTENEFAYSQRIAKASIPSGACQHWQRIRMPHPQPERRPCALVLNLKTGELGGTNGVEEALKMAERLVAEGRGVEAMQIIALVKAKM